MASICCSPPESRLPIDPKRGTSSGKNANTESSVHGSACAKWLEAVATRFSRAVRLGKICLPSGTNPKPKLAIWYEGLPVMSCPRQRTCPPLGLTMPMVA